MNEIQLNLTTGLTLYVQARTPMALYYKSGGYEAYNAADWSAYAIPLVEPVAGSGIYFGTIPSSLPAGLTLMPVYVQSGGSPATTDVRYACGCDNLTLSVDWSGTAVNSLAPFGTWNGPAIIALPASQAPLSVGRVAAILDQLYTARGNIAAAGVISVTVDGEQTVFSSPAQLDSSILMWERKLAILTGQRKRLSRFDLSGF